MEKEQINLPDKISVFDAMAYCRKAHSELFDESIPRKEIQRYIDNAITELNNIANVANEWESFLFKIANKIY